MSDQWNEKAKELLLCSALPGCTFIEGGHEEHNPKCLEWKRGTVAAALREQGEKVAVLEEHNTIVHEQLIEIEGQLAQTRTEFERLKKIKRDFPINGRTGRIPYSIAEKAYLVYAEKFNASQSLDRLGERGGFHESELDMFVPGWREEVSEIAALRAKLAEAKEMVHNVIEILALPARSPQRLNVVNRVDAWLAANREVGK